MLKIEIILMSLLLLPLITINYIWVTAIVLTAFMLPLCSILINKLSYSIITQLMSSDSMSFTLSLLTIWVLIIMIVASVKIVTHATSPKTFIVNLLLLLIILVNCFLSSNLFIFYIWFEASLIPTIILIISWGYQPERAQASIYLIIYTVAASLPILIALCKVYISSKTATMPIFINIEFPKDYSSTSLA